MGEVNSPAGDASHPTVHYEQSDVSFRGVLLFAGILIASAIVLHLALWGVFAHFAARREPVEPLPSLLTRDAVGQLPPEPRLQISPRQDLRELRAAEDARLGGYGWVDRQAGVVHVPIARAMQVIAEQGLPPDAEESEKREGGETERNAEKSSQ